MIAKAVTTRNKRKKLHHNSKVQREMSILALMKAHLKNFLIQMTKLMRHPKHRKKDLEPRALQPTKLLLKPRTPSRFRRRF